MLSTMSAANRVIIVTFQRLAEGAADLPVRQPRCNRFSKPRHAPLTEEH
jgi:hypothetical protein